MNRYLQRLARRPCPVRVGIIGSGSSGRGLGLQAHLTPGLECVAMADIDLEAALAGAALVARPHQLVETPAAAAEAIARGRVAVTADGLALAECDHVDVVIEATNSIRAGGRHAEAALRAGKHTIMMNYEAALCFGPYLASLARGAGVVYSVCDGDQPAVLARLADEVRFMGFTLVMAGNVKGYLDRAATAKTVAGEAAKRDLHPKMCASYTDGTKLNIEMAIVANGLGLRPAVAGMIGPRAGDAAEAPALFDLERRWDGRTGYVDYLLGAQPSGGVFVVGHSDHPHQRRVLSWLPAAMGAGPFYVFKRPYHLVHIEAMASVAAAVLDGEAVLGPDHGFRTDVVTYAKKPLRAGDALDGPGGDAGYGLIERADDGLPEGLPICLSEGVRLTRAAAPDQRITMDMVAHDPAREDFVMFERARRAAAGC